MKAFIMFKCWICKKESIVTSNGKWTTFGGDIHKKFSCPDCFYNQTIGREKFEEER